MSTVRDTIHEHHVELAERLAAHVDALENGSPTADPDALVAFLKGDLLPHAHGEEEYLYPAVDPLVKQHGSATATMRVDHQFIAGYVASLEETARALGTASSAERPALLKRAARLALQLQALLQVHLEKEESVYLPLFERYLSSGEQQRILDGMHEGAPAEGASAPDATDNTLDVRELPPAQRHARIFALFDALEPGTSFVLVNDHDPKPLRYQLLAERPGQLEWEYLEAGPEVWRVRMGKADAPVGARDRGTR
jgi:uncharacterized protein (DUF2249 family)/hemerythrin-like domain-containing protein